MKNLKPIKVTFPNQDCVIHSVINSLDFRKFIEQLLTKNDLSNQIIFITGYSGSGKTDFSERCSPLLADCPVVHLDDFRFNSKSLSKHFTDVPSLSFCLEEIKSENPRFIIIEGISDNIHDVINSLSLDKIYFLHSSAESFSHIMRLRALQYTGGLEHFRDHWFGKSIKSVFWIRNFILTKYLHYSSYCKTIPIYNDIQTMPTKGWAQPKGYIM